MDVGFLRAAAAVQRKLATGKTAEYRLRNDSMQLLTRSIGVRGADDIHRKFQEFVDRNEMQVEGGLRRGIRSRGLDRFVLARRVIDRAVKLGSADVNEALEVAPRLELLGQFGQCHAIGFEIAP